MLLLHRASFHMLQSLRLSRCRPASSLLKSTSIPLTTSSHINSHHPTLSPVTRQTLHTTASHLQKPIPDQAMDTIRNTIGENFGGIAQKLSTSQFSLEEVPAQDGKVVVITGGTEGIGYGCTHTYGILTTHPKYHPTTKYHQQTVFSPKTSPKSTSSLNAKKSSTAP